MVASNIVADWTATSWLWRSSLGLVLGAGVPSMLAVMATFRGRQRTVAFMVVTSVVVIPVSYPTAARLLRGVTHSELDVREITCDLYPGRTQELDRSCLRFAIHAGNGRLLYAGRRMRRAIPDRGPVCIASFGEVILEAHACVP